MLIEDTPQEPLADQSVGQVEAGQGEREADVVQTVLAALQVARDRCLLNLYTIYIDRTRKFYIT